MNTMHNRKNRAWEIDMTRGIAVILMSVFHIVFDLAVYYGADINYSSGFWFYVGRSSAILFMFVSGLSSTFSRNPIKRGLIVLCCGLVVTVFSIPVMGANYIRFGILHFFGTVMILKGIFEAIVKNTQARDITAAALIPASFILGRILPGIKTNTPLLLPFGVMPIGFSSYDYYPVFPWLAVFSAGALMASVFYKSRASIFVVDPFERNIPLIRPLCFFGKHSLVIYLLHQPVILAVLYILSSAAKILS